MKLTYFNEKIIRTSGSHNCGGRCVLKEHVKNKRVVRISTEDDIPDTFDKPQLRVVQNVDLIVLVIQS